MYFLSWPKVLHMVFCCIVCRSGGTEWSSWRCWTARCKQCMKPCSLIRWCLFAYMTQETKIGVIRSFMGEELTLQEKLTIVRKRYHEHKQQKTIARELCCNQSTVSRVLQQFLSSDGLETKKRSGRPSVVSDEVKGAVDKGIKKRRTATSSELANEVLDKTGRRVSERTIRRLRHELTYILFTRLLSPS